MSFYEDQLRTLTEEVHLANCEVRTEEVHLDFAEFGELLLDWIN